MQNKPSNSSDPGGRHKRPSAKNKVRFFSHSTEVFKHHIPTEFILLGVIELIALTISFYVGVALRFDTMPWHVIVSAHSSGAFVYALVMLTSLVAFGAYQRQSQQMLSKLAMRISSSLIIGLVALGLTYYVIPQFFLGRGALALAVFVSFVSIMAVRLLFMKIMSDYDLRIRVLILGAGKAANLVRQAQATGELDGMNIINYMPMPGDLLNSKGLSLVYTEGALAKYVGEKQIDVIVLAMDERREGLPAHDLLDCKMGGVEVIDLLTFFERNTDKIRLDIMQPSWLFLSNGFKVSHFRRMWKRIMDIASVLLLAPIVAPVALLAAFAIFAESRGKGSVFYAQTRVGENGRPFQIYKFRSMVTNAEQDGTARWAVKNDSRITRTGAILRKFRFDEIPQLYNILKGDMSFVGPRPERPEFVQRLAENIPYYNERHRVKPGLTGWAQIRYPYGASEEDGQEKLQYDLYYVKNYSVLLDALVLLQTAEVVLLGRGAH
ncbi:MAG: TIGR03013 family XrtA/PEP-CTERM system glycosyltransferase [Gammaproteobacteria bacterium]